ncbi:antitoxin [Isoptericola sp. BMS4]|uniref:antitoxin n=1 Tax=Isoptericola sp. BMS4 TaxID=2527875 RepID=UPI00141E3707|nr:antitoxin [Isoptericola sp. BMS4]
MKVSVSLKDRDLRYLDAYAQRKGLPSRSATVHAAIKALQACELEAEYEEAIDEWASSDDAQAWDATVGDGLDADAPR